VRKKEITLREGVHMTDKAGVFNSQTADLCYAKCLTSNGLVLSSYDNLCTATNRSTIQIRRIATLCPTG
jgi:hypothetical protein